MVCDLITLEGKICLYLCQRRIAVFTYNIELKGEYYGQLNQ